MKNITPFKGQLQQPQCFTILHLQEIQLQLGLGSDLGFGLGLDMINERILWMTRGRMALRHRPFQDRPVAVYMSSFIILFCLFCFFFLVIKIIFEPQQLFSRSTW